MQCPVCSKVFNELADPLPFSHHAQSQLICAMSGEPINEHNPPMALPNGYIYGENVSVRGSVLYAVRFVYVRNHEISEMKVCRVLLNFSFHVLFLVAGHIVPYRGVPYIHRNISIGHL